MEGGGRYSCIVSPNGWVALWRSSNFLELAVSGVFALGGAIPAFSVQQLFVRAVGGAAVGGAAYGLGCLATAISY